MTLMARPPSLQSVPPRAVGARQGTGTDGFTLVELVVALGIASFALAVALAAPRAGAARSSVEAAAARLAASLRIARAEAVRTNVTRLVLLNPATGAYGSEDPPDQLLGAMLGMTVAGDGIEHQGHLVRIRFRPDGTATGAILAIEAGGQRRAVVLVDELTGAVSLQAEPRR